MTHAEAIASEQLDKPPFLQQLLQTESDKHQGRLQVEENRLQRKQLLHAHRVRYVTAMVGKINQTLFDIRKQLEGSSNPERLKYFESHYASLLERAHELVPSSAHQIHDHELLEGDGHIPHIEGGDVSPHIHGHTISMDEQFHALHLDFKKLNSDYSRYNASQKVIEPRSFGDMVFTADAAAARNQRR
jgi:hypothetical protein